MGGTEEWSAGARTSTRVFGFSAVAVVVAFLASFGAWASSAPLAGAIVASGTVVADGHSRLVQHLDGGIVDAIHVEEGERVEAGQPLLTFEPTTATARRDGLRNRRVAQEARIARLEAERDGAADVAFDADLAARATRMGAGELLSEQRREFHARLRRHRQELSIMKQRVVALREEATGMEAQEAALDEQLAVLRDETGRKKRLLEQGLANRSEYSQLLRSEAELVGRSGQIVAQRLASKTQIANALEQVSRLESQRVETALAQLNELRSQLSDTREELRQAETVVERLVVRAPDAGVIYDMPINASGSVVEPGEAIMRLLPTERGLIVEARIRPHEIDDVRVGQSARLLFTALNMRRTPAVNATVSYVSANRLASQRGEPDFYTARLAIDETPVPGFDRARVYPGMPVEAQITTGTRTFAEYLVKPLTDSFGRAFRYD